MQEILRERVKIVKALYGDIYRYIDIAEMLEMNINSFYNWLNGAYDLGSEKQKQLEIFINDILN